MFSAATLFFERGAASVTTTNIDGRQGSPRGDERLKTTFADARHLHRFFDTKFDIVFGIAVTEHILNIPMWLHSTREVLEEGGLAFYHGGQIWSSPRGHHLFVTVESGRKYRFNDGDDVVSDWSHLLYTPREMRRHLLDVKGISPGDTNGIVHWIYFASSLNRYTQARIRSHFEQSPLKILHRQPIQANRPPEDPEALLHEKIGDGSDFSVASTSFYLQKA